MTTKKKSVKKKAVTKKRIVKKRAAPKKSKDVQVSDNPETAEELRHWGFAAKFVELANATRAYKAVYGEKVTDKTAGVNGCKLLKHARVKGYIDTIKADALKSAQITVNSVLSRYADWADADISEAVEWGLVDCYDSEGDQLFEKSGKPIKRMTLNLKEAKDIPPHVLSAIEGVSNGKEGLKFSFVSKKGANDALAKFLGLDKKVVEHQGNIGIMIADDESDL